MKLYRVYVPRIGVPYVEIRARSKPEAVEKVYKLAGLNPKIQAGVDRSAGNQSRP